VQTFVLGKEKEVLDVDLLSTTPPDTDKLQRAAAVEVVREDLPQRRPV
jgi:hypothetical protein